jgi:hypothetical protein
MSTPVTQLPPTTAPPGNVRHDEDQIVADVLSEMQSERHPAQMPPSPSPQIPATAPPQIVQQYMLPSQLPSSHSSSMYGHHQQSDKIFGVIEKEHAIRAAIAALVALVLFYPESLSSVYVKIPSIGTHLEQNDKLVRALLLAVLLYVLMWKLNI